MKSIKLSVVTIILLCISISCGEDNELPLACEYALSSFNNANEAYADQPSQGSCVALQNFFFNLIQECNVEDIKDQLNVNQQELDSISTAIQTLNC